MAGGSRYLSGKKLDPIRMKERENPRKRRVVEHRQSIYQYISNSGECEERNPKRATPLMADEKGARYMSESISWTRYTETLKEKKREPLVGREIRLHRAPKPKWQTAVLPPKRRQRTDSCRPAVIITQQQKRPRNAYNNMDKRASS